MTAPAPEKAAPIPADVLELARELARNAAAVRMEGGWVNEAAEPIARAIMQDRADRASQEERIREDERDRLYEAADRHSREVSPRNFLARQGGMFPFERALQRGDAS